MHIQENVFYTVNVTYKSPHMHKKQYTKKRYSKFGTFVNLKNILLYEKIPLTKRYNIQCCPSDLLHVMFGHCLTAIKIFRIACTFKKNTNVDTCYSRHY